MIVDRKTAIIATSMLLVRSIVVREESNCGKCTRDYIQNIRN